MNGLDIILAVILSVSTIYGLLKGFVRISIGVAGLSVSLALALRMATSGPSWFEGVFANEQLSWLAAFIAVLVGGLVATAAMAWLAWKVVKAAQIGWLDRCAGGLVGLGGSVLAIAGMLVALTTFAPSTADLMRSSTLLPWIVGAADVAASILPEEAAKIYWERRSELLST